MQHLLKITTIFSLVLLTFSCSQEEDLYIPPISAYQEINRGIDLQDVVFGNEVHHRSKDYQRAWLLR